MTTPTMREELAELWRFRHLMQQLVAREMVVRYKNSVFGFLWSIVPPLLQVFVYTFVMRSILLQNCPNYSAYLLCGLIPWTFAQNGILDSSMSLLMNYNIIKKVYLPREIIPLSQVISNLIHFLLGWAVYILAFFVVARLLGIRLPLRWQQLFFPIVTLNLVCFVLGISLLVSALNVFYEDVKFILQTAFGLLFFLMPVVYPADKIYYWAMERHQAWIYKLYMLNPVAACINAYTKTILEPVPRGSFGMPGDPLPMDWIPFVQSGVVSLLILLGGYWYFNRVKWKFVER